VLPAGKLLGNSVGWHQSPVDGSLWLHAAVGAHFVGASVSRVRHATEDHAWGAAQLVTVGERRPGFIPTLVASAPTCINIRSYATGDTVLHHFARTRQIELVAAWLDSAQSHYTPIRNRAGDTPVQVAIRYHEKGIARVLWRALAQGSMNAVSSPLVTAELALLASTMPELVPQFLGDVEGVVVRTLGTFRSELSRAAEVLGLPTMELPAEDAAAGSARDDDAPTGATPRAWAHAFGAHLKPKMLVAFKVVLMPELLGDATSGPFHLVVERCNAEVFESRLMELMVQSKWETNVWPRLRWIIGGYATALALSSTAMVASVGLGSPSSLEHGSTTWVDTAQAAAVVVEVAALANEVHQQVCGCTTSL
jgi:hypothetical protein